MSKQTLYHISRMPCETVPRFTPRIPEHRVTGEDSTIPRICAAPTISGCILAHPEIGMYMSDLLDLHFSSPLELQEKEYKCMETGEIGILARVYRFEAEPELLVTPETLDAKGYVPDALKTGEHWITKPVQPVAISYLLATGVDRDPVTGERTFHYSMCDNLSDFGTFLSYQYFKLLIEDLPNFRERLHSPFTKEEILAMKEEDDIFFDLIAAELEGSMSPPIPSTKES